MAMSSAAGSGQSSAAGSGQSSAHREGEVAVSRGEDAGVRNKRKAVRSRKRSGLAMVAMALMPPESCGLPSCLCGLMGFRHCAGVAYRDRLIPGDGC